MLISQKGQESISILLSYRHLLIYVHTFDVIPPQLCSVDCYVPSVFIMQNPLLVNSILHIITQLLVIVSFPQSFPV